MIEITLNNQSFPVEVKDKRQFVEAVGNLLDYVPADHAEELKKRILVELRDLPGKMPSKEPQSSRLDTVMKGATRTWREYVLGVVDDSRMGKVEKAAPEPYGKALLELAAMDVAQLRRWGENEKIWPPGKRGRLSLNLGRTYLARRIKQMNAAK